MQIKSEELLSYLSDLELKLNSFSFEELTASEASRLKSSFQNFKHNLENKITPKKEDFGVRLSPSESLKIVPKKINKKKFDDELLIAKVSHEIRTPLNGIIGFTELLSEEKMTEQQHSHVQAIQTASNTLLSLINELLEYSKLSSGNFLAENVNFNFSRILKDISYLCQTLIVNSDVDFRVNISDGIPENLIGDPSKLSQVLLNLIGNSIKFVTKGSIHLNIEVDSLTNDNVILNFTIKDTGIGIAEKNLENIFDYYKQAESDTHKIYGGTGLGLSIVKNIVENLQGSISVTSELEVGTTFLVALPYKIGENKEKLINSVENEDLKTQENQIKFKNILVFEDNTMNQKLIKNRLESWDCNCFITDTIDYGMEILTNEKIDIILMDLRMPEISGFDVAKIIRANKNETINSIPIVALTADFTVKDKNKSALSGINDYILKPFDSKDLLQKIITNIKHKKAIMLKDNLVISEASALAPAIINLSYLLEECFGNVEMLEELIRLFKQNTLEFVGKTKVDLKNGNIDGIIFNTHKIKAGLKMMHTKSLFRIVDQMHKVCFEDKDLKYLNFLFECFLKEYPLIDSAIEVEIAGLKEKQ